VTGLFGALKAGEHLSADRLKRCAEIRTSAVGLGRGRSVSLSARPARHECGDLSKASRRERISAHFSVSRSSDGARGAGDSADTTTPTRSKAARPQEGRRQPARERRPTRPHEAASRERSSVAHHLMLECRRHDAWTASLSAGRGPRGRRGNSAGSTLGIRPEFRPSGLESVVPPLAPRLEVVSALHGRVHVHEDRELRCVRSANPRKVGERCSEEVAGGRERILPESDLSALRRALRKRENLRRLLDAVST
jgi:hypothetical protein